MKHTMFFAALAAILSLALTVSAQEEGFVSLFNGHDLTGWTGDPAVWSVDDGALTGRTSDSGPAKLKYNTFLIYDGGVEIPENFILRFDIKLSRAGNSGMQYRSWVMEGDEPYRVSGYQADFDGAGTYSGICFGEGFRGIIAERGTISEVDNNHEPHELARFAENDALKAELKIEDWNAYEVIAHENLMIHKINGKVMSVLLDSDKEMRRTDGILAIQAHAGPPMEVQVKNVRIKAE
ncbi:MAG: DUF1080 domain-containing protein [Thermoguttaceae bacterium]|nr:DUF1080 domain-containing protein [Thermoguttaceae bacterium]